MMRIGGGSLPKIVLIMVFLGQLLLIYLLMKSNQQNQQENRLLLKELQRMEQAELQRLNQWSLRNEEQLLKSQSHQIDVVNSRMDILEVFVRDAELSIKKSCISTK